MVDRLTLSILLTATVLLSACDTSSASEEEEACLFSASTAVEEAFFPTAVGTSWAYTYRFHIDYTNSILDEEENGTLTWEITERTASCNSIQLTVEERFEGEFFVDYHDPADGRDTTYPVQRSTSKTFQLDTLLTIPGYADRVHGFIDYSGGPTIYSIPWMYPAEASDTISRDTTIWCGFGGCRQGGYTLQRGVGMTSWYYRDSNRFNGQSHRLTLQDN